MTTNPTPADQGEDAVKVRQSDRDAAADLMAECSPYLGDCAMKNSVELALRQAFARHRSRAEGRSTAGEDASLCDKPEWIKHDGGGIRLTPVARAALNAAGGKQDG